MSATLGDAFNRGRLDAFVTNISERGYLFQNNNLRLNEMPESHRFRNVAEGAIADAGWAWGAQFGDLNNDGANELFVANGFISADPNKSYWYSMSKIAGANGRFFEDAATWPAFGNASLSGYERSRVYINRGVAGWVDVAKKVGVSEATVSRVLNGKPGISDATRAAVLTALDVIGYERPTHLRVRRARMVGLVVPELQNPIFPALAEVVGGALAQRGFNAVLAADSACAMAYWGVAMTNFHPVWAAGNPGGEPSPAELRKGSEAAAKAVARSLHFSRSAFSRQMRNWSSIDASR